MHEDRASEKDVARVVSMVNAYQQTCVVAAAVELGVIDTLFEKGEMSLRELAGALHVDRSALARLVRALAALEIVASSADSASLTKCGKLLARNGPAPGINAWTLLVEGEFMAVWGSLNGGVRTGRAVFGDRFGCSPWAHRQTKPVLNAAFNRVASGEQVRAISALLRNCDFTGKRCVADIGGGHGNLLAGVLRKHLTLRGVLFDLPHVLAQGDGVLERAGVAERCTVVGGSFLDAVPEGADVHIMKHVLHNWNDDDCTRILRNIRKAIDHGGQLLILENVVQSDDLAAALPTIMLDIHMLVVHGGRERTRDEYEELLSSTGFRLSRHVPAQSGRPDILEAAAA